MELGESSENTIPSVPDVLTPTLSEVSFGEFSVPNMTPRVPDISTPTLSVMELGDNNTTNETACNDSCEESSLIEERELDNSFLLHKYISDIFVDKDDIKHQEVSHILKDIRIKNVNRVIIGHLNVNFIAAKLDAIKLIIPGNVDIMVFCETKLDASYPMAQLLIPGFRMPFRLDRNAYGGGLLIYVRSDIPCKQVNQHEFSENIEGIFLEVNFRKSKWLLLGTYHPPSQNDNFYFNNMGRALDIYTQIYDT